MNVIQQIRNELSAEWIPAIYADRIRPLRTRSFKLEIPERENDPVIQSTLLGTELRVGRRRIACPDINTARYLAVFAAIGCQNVAVPYDITQIGPLADELESALRLLIERIERERPLLTPQMYGRLRAALIRANRNEIKQIGAGEMMPLFDRSTKQRET